jgi:DNA-binding CsgD family transcriptional regulator
MTLGLDLTPREHDVVEKLILGHSIIDIGKLLFITPKGVKYHLTNIYRKRGVKSRYELQSQYLRDGLITQVVMPKAIPEIELPMGVL